jgi:hypothetical protein
MYGAWSYGSKHRNLDTNTNRYLRSLYKIFWSPVVSRQQRLQEPFIALCRREESIVLTPFHRLFSSSPIGYTKLTFRDPTSGLER